MFIYLRFKGKVVSFIRNKSSFVKDLWLKLSKYEETH